jgi:hypothetical protein
MNKNRFFSSLNVTEDFITDPLAKRNRSEDPDPTKMSRIRNTASKVQRLKGSTGNMCNKMLTMIDLRGISTNRFKNPVMAFTRLSRLRNTQPCIEHSELGKLIVSYQARLLLRFFFKC